MNHLILRRKVCYGMLALLPWLWLPGQARAADGERLEEEAKLRSQLLHEVLHGALQVMHRDFFKEEEKSKIPSESLEDVFEEMEKTWGVRIEWLAVDTKAMNVDHRADDAFEKKAVEVISSGAEAHDMKEGGLYRYAGVIPLGNRCLKCHVPDRTSLEERKAAVVISMPLQPVKREP
ncbi:DUF3365 domain-containing protein [Luteolibacter sp. SL250]|uniref:c-type heme family protein n=1 Tax=Luteolibacter sp. SL250 TaxID=2995170 RepID=UPI00226E2AB9|nr:DUF3365 domain-containing protein [Luteolibacter sp. SL250]WAC18598.1 DUF3365 domain-containing protein [Luteolibacter sp. SL250]